MAFLRNDFRFHKITTVHSVSISATMIRIFTTTDQINYVRNRISVTKDSRKNRALKPTSLVVEFSASRSRRLEEAHESVTTPSWASARGRQFTTTKSRR